MTATNPGNFSEFLLQGFPVTRPLQIPLFLIFLAIYLIILFGNVILFAVISLTSNLHTPMYIFLLNLSIIDISFTSNILPNLLHVLCTQQRNISFWGCMIQMYLFMSFLSSEVNLLTAMAYDRYLAICDPLHYIVRMNLKRCAWLITVVIVISFLDPVAHTVHISKLSFCSSNLVDHFFCDLNPLVKISCSDTFNVEVLTYAIGTLVSVSSFLLTLTSYILIIATILKIQSSQGKQKAFSTCASHLISVIIFYGSIICLYMRPTASYSPERDKFFALLYTVLIPLLNPVIYTIKNKEFKHAFHKLGQRSGLL